MDRNKEITRIKREEIRRLKEHLTLLQQRLERYALSTNTCWSKPKVDLSRKSLENISQTAPFLHLTLSTYFCLVSLHVYHTGSFLFPFRYLSYGSGPKRFPLADVLQYAMEFASSKPVCTSPVEDIDTSAPPGGTTGHQLPPPRHVGLWTSGASCMNKCAAFILNVGVETRCEKCVCTTVFRFIKLCTCTFPSYITIYMQLKAHDTSLDPHLFRRKESAMYVTIQWQHSLFAVDPWQVEPSFLTRVWSPTQSGPNSGRVGPY